MMLRPLDLLCASLARAWTDCPPTLVLASTDPLTWEERDGYGQRVMAIDEVLAAGLRIYVKFCEERRGRPMLVHENEGTSVLEVADCDPVSKAVLAAILGYGANIYVHSIYGLQQEIVRKVIRGRLGRCVLDIHGAVPEECALYGNDSLAQMFNILEYEFYGSVDHVMCVSQKMADHLTAKHGPARIRPSYFQSFTDQNARISMAATITNARK